ncbi:MAG TPA: hypothetical protein VFP60_02580 [Pseudolabrys sp.]|nr:hypothetical protein [Pseudolabrys sp.]
MPRIRFASALFCLLLAPASPSGAQNAMRAPQQRPADAASYKPVAISLPQPVNDPGLESFRKQLADVAQRKDRAALAKLVARDGFFWTGEKGERADRRKSGVDNLAAALGLNNKEGAGWDMLASFAEDPTASPSREHKAALCAPADPTFDGKAFNDLLAASKTEVEDWGYPISSGIEVRSGPQANAPAIEKLGLFFVRVMPDADPNAPAFLRIITPAGKTGFVAADSIAPIGSDQICYVKDAGGWKIGGYVGPGDSQ